MTTQTDTVVVTDANVLINFCHIGQLALLGALKPYRFVVPVEVINEITEPAQKAEIANALEQGLIAKAVIDSLKALALFGTLRDVMGRGEAACLALAETAGYDCSSRSGKTDEGVGRTWRAANADMPVPAHCTG